MKSLTLCLKSNSLQIQPSPDTKKALAAIASIGSRILESITPTAAGAFLAHIKALFGGTPQTFLQRVGHGEMDLEKTGSLLTF
ncbi:unnamed protein product [Allacma fusca]|uniref:Uncharacterized protein n=1 Tax=Allacma fusca TaxID=39272 RepID=A0A8J2NVQ3_9HEXA|nr:unnamed protein product [Allacma fusca]